MFYVLFMLLDCPKLLACDLARNEVIFALRNPCHWIATLPLNIIDHRAEEGVSVAPRKLLSIWCK